jgi:hypothetical protein
LTGPRSSPPAGPSSMAAMIYSSWRFATRRNWTRRPRRTLYWLCHPRLVTGACSGEPYYGRRRRSRTVYDTRARGRRQRGSGDWQAHQERVEELEKAREGRNRRRAWRWARPEAKGNGVLASIQGKSARFLWPRCTTRRGGTLRLLG